MERHLFILDLFNSSEVKECVYFKNCSVRSNICLFFFFNNETDFDWLNQKGIYWPPEDLMESKTVTVNLQQQQ